VKKAGKVIIIEKPCGRTKIADIPGASAALLAQNAKMVAQNLLRCGFPST
jgi:hypothetical protein